MSYEYNDLVYWGNQELIEEILDKALDNNEDCDFEYHASW